MSKPILLALALLLPGCASSGSPFSEGGERSRSIRIEVMNLNFNQATLYALRFEERIRLGVVGGKQEETFAIPWTTSAPMRVEMRLLGGGRCFTHEITVDPGDEMYVEVPLTVTNNPDCVASP